LLGYILTFGELFMYSSKAHKGFGGDRIKFMSKAFDFLCDMPRLLTHRWQQLKK